MDSKISVTGGASDYIAHSSPVKSRKKDVTLASGRISERKISVSKSVQMNNKQKSFVTYSLADTIEIPESVTPSQVEAFTLPFKESIIRQVSREINILINDEKD
jgi:hypothetical protein